MKITKSSLTNPCFQARAQRRISAEQALRHRYFRWETAAYGYMAKQTKQALYFWWTICNVQKQTASTQLRFLRTKLFKKE